MVVCHLFAQASHGYGGNGVTLDVGHLGCLLVSYWLAQHGAQPSRWVQCLFHNLTPWQFPLLTLECGDRVVRDEQAKTPHFGVRG